MLHGRARRGGERPWFHRYPIQVPFFGFLTSMISTEQKFLKELSSLFFFCPFVSAFKLSRIEIQFNLLLRRTQWKPSGLPGKRADPLVR